MPKLIVTKRDGETVELEGKAGLIQPQHCRWCIFG